MSSENSESSSTSIIRREDYDEDNQTDNDVDEPVTKKFRGSSKPYDLYKTYESLEVCMKELTTGQIEQTKWSKREKRDNEAGEKRFYKCSVCSKRLYILIHRTSLEVSVYIQDQDHEHDENDKGIPKKTKDKVLSLYYDENKKAKDIGRWLRKNINDGYIELTDTQINNLINRYKRLPTTEDPGKSIENLQRWAESKCQIPDDDDTMFVISKFILEPNNVNFRIFMTTKRLISLTRYSTHIATDATFKLNWINFPLLMCGTTDKTRSFHPFGILLSKSETTEDFEFMFRCVKDLAYQIYDFDFNVNVLLADCAGAITNGFKLVFPELNTRIICWAHVNRKIQENLRGVDEETCKKIATDFENLQSSTTTSHLNAAYNLLKQKWQVFNNQKINDMFEYFNNQWLCEANVGWYESFSNGFPSTNNALEATNNVIKEKATLRDRLPVRDFLKSMDKLLYNWSFDRHSDFRTTIRFHQKPLISTHEYTLGHNWLKKNKRIVKIKHQNKEVYMVTSTKVDFEATKDGCKKYLNTNGPWNTFQDYLAWNDSYKVVEINRQVWGLSTCTCQYWRKHYTCKHVIGISYELELFAEFPSLDLQIEQNAKRGRRKKATSALNRTKLAL